MECLEPGQLQPPDHQGQHPQRHQKGQATVGPNELQVTAARGLEQRADSRGEQGHGNGCRNSRTRHHWELKLPSTIHTRSEKKGHGGTKSGGVGQTLRVYHQNAGSVRDSEERSGSNIPGGNLKNWGNRKSKKKTQQQQHVPSVGREKESISRHAADEETESKSVRDVGEMVVVKVLHPGRPAYRSIGPHPKLPSHKLGRLSRVGEISALNDTAKPNVIRSQTQQPGPRNWLG